MTGGETVSVLERTFRNALLKLSFNNLNSGGDREHIVLNMHICISSGGNLEESASDPIYYLAA